MLKVEKLTKIYKTRKKEIVALDNINFELKEGEHLAIIGPNGSGKTTLVKMLTQLSRPSSGRILINNKEISDESKWLFGLMLGQMIIYNRLTVKQNLDYFASIYNVSNKDYEIKKILDYLEISDKSNDYADHLSYGTRSKLAFARAIIHNPKILILDEPTNGLDPASADSLREVIRNYQTVIFLTHNLYEVTSLADKLLFLKKGKQIYFGSLEDFCKKHNVDKNDKEAIEKLKEMYVL